MRIAVMRCSMTMALLTVLLFAGVGADADIWSRETVDTFGETSASSCSLALDGSWTPHLSYWDGENDDLMYAVRTTSGWETTTLASGEGVGHVNDLALDNQGRPRICYAGSTSSTDKILMQATWNGASWALDEVSGNYATWGMSLAIDGSGYSHIACSDQDRIRYLWEDIYGWHTQTVYTAGGTDYAISPSLVLDADGHPHMSFNLGDRVCYARHRETGAWGTEFVDSTHGLSYSNIGDSCIALDSDGNPGISYIRNTPSGRPLMFAEWDRDSWDITTGWNNSLAYDSVGHPHIAYSVPGSTWDVRYAAYDGSSWNIEIADSMHYQAHAVSMALDPEDTAHIALTHGADLYYTKNGPGVAPDAAATDSPELASFGLLLLSAPLIGALRRRRT